MLLDYTEHHPTPVCGDCIGVDDFAYKKGQNYCTVIVNEKDHNIIDILEGRDGRVLKEWLKLNKQVRTVTRDRSSAYAKAIAEELPDAMQIADRFDLHQNLMECVKDILNTKLPAYMKIPKVISKNSDLQLVVAISDDTAISGSKKNTDIVHCESTYFSGELARRKVYEEILKLNVAGYTNRKIAKLLKVSRNTISKVIESNIDELCSNNRKMLLDKDLTEISTAIKDGKTATVIYHELKADGKIIGSRSNFHSYLDKIVRSLGLILEKFRHQPMPLPDNTIPQKDFDYLKRTDIFQSLWNSRALEESHRQFLFETYPIVAELQKRILEFRQIFIYKNPFLLYLFIDNCLTSSITRLTKFAKGLRQDFEAVENAVTSNLSNGFVEGCNNKIKMVKRVMYGRCSIRSLKAKLIHRPSMANYG